MKSSKQQSPAPTITHNNITFVDAQAMRLQYTETFDAPSLEELNELKNGDYVKVCVNDERFWLEVQGINNGIITARVDNDLIRNGFKHNDILEFPRNAIFTILEP